VKDICKIPNVIDGGDGGDGRDGGGFGTSTDGG
jgi:hypothetical protein